MGVCGMDTIARVGHSAHSRPRAAHTAGRTGAPVRGRDRGGRLQLALRHLHLRREFRDLRIERLQQLLLLLGGRGRLAAGARNRKPNGHSKVRGGLNELPSPVGDSKETSGC